MLVSSIRSAWRVVLFAALGLPSQPKDTAMLAMECLMVLGLNLCCLVKHCSPMCTRWPRGKASASRAEDPGFESGLRRDFFRVESYK